MRFSGLWLLGCLCCAARVQAQSTPLVVASGLYDTNRASGLVVLVWPLSDTVAINFTQAGWTSAASFTLRLAPELRWHSSVELTPEFGHLSHDLYAADGDTPLPSFSDTSLRLATGQIYEREALRVEVQALVVKEWLSGAAWSGSRAFAAPFGGAESEITLSQTRVRDAFEGTIEGVRFALRGKVLIGDALWADADLSLRWGVDLGPLFVHGVARAFWAYLDTPITNAWFGGSWDVLGASALFGHPLGAFRPDYGAVSTLGADLSVHERVWIGMRGSLLLAEPSSHGGLALLAHAAISGMHVFAGVAAPDAELERVIFLCGASAALLFSPR